MKKILVFLGFVFITVAGNAQSQAAWDKEFDRLDWKKAYTNIRPNYTWLIIQSF